MKFLILTVTSLIALGIGEADARTINKGDSSLLSQSNGGDLSALPGPAEFQSCRLRAAESIHEYSQSNDPDQLLEFISAVADGHCSGSLNCQELINDYLSLRRNCSRHSRGMQHNNYQEGDCETCSSKANQINQSCGGFGGVNTNCEDCLQHDSACHTCDNNAVCESQCEYEQTETAYQECILSCNAQFPCFRQ
ncbi:MAG: hypothetical protein EA369_06130 [Bradymonadales bacterium]|nr:MAG: hypothetical protein EA369_06130 [Bradymonadales bacterium]